MSAARGAGDRSWWARSWLDALEGSEATDRSRLHKGRSLARRGAVRRLDVLPGHLSATVVDPTGELYEVTIGVRRLADGEWEQVADAIGARAAHLAALFDGELDPGVVDDAAAVDVQLLPGPSAISPDCPCGDRSEPCAHAAAAAYVAASEIDRDPFALFLLRGIGREELLERVRGHRRSPEGQEPSSPGSPGDGVDATRSWSGHSLDEDLAPLPEAVATLHAHVPPQPGRHLPWDADPAPRHGIDPNAIDELALDAVERAWAMLAVDAPSGLRATARADLARRAASHPERLAELASLAAVTPQRLRQWSDAWRVAGDDGVTVVADPSTWSTDQQELAAGRELLVDMGVPQRSIALNYDSLGMAASTWLVLGSDRRWYRLKGATKHQDLRLVSGPASDVRDVVDPPAP